MKWGRIARPTVLCFLWASLAFTSEPAVITGRVFDVYHRPVQAARVVTMDRSSANGQHRLVPGASQAIVDQAGMYRLSVPAGRYILAVLPPPRSLDFAAIFPAYLGDIVDADKAPVIEVRPGELRPFQDFLLLEVEAHRIAGRILGSARAQVILSSLGGYAGPLQEGMTDQQGGFHFDHVPAGSYKLEARSPGKSGSVQIKVAAPELTGIRIHLRPAPR